MAFGLPPRYEQEIILDDLDQNCFLVIALDAAKKLNWNIEKVSKEGFVAYTKFSMSSWSEEVTIKIDEEKVNVRSKCIGNQFIDYGKNKKNVNNFINEVDDLKVTLSQEEIAEKLLELNINYLLIEGEEIENEPINSESKLAKFYSLFKPREGYYITPILMYLNVFVFILMVFSGVGVFIPENEGLLKWGANFRPLTLEGEWWRLFTSCFLHIGVFHLLFNMYALMYIGLMLEPLLGKARMLAAYIITGIASSVASLWWYDFTISAGASGAIFGMYGVFIALLSIRLLDNSRRKSLFTSIGIFIGYNLLYGLQPNSGIDNAAHIGGLLTGILVGFAFIPSIRKKNIGNSKFYIISILTILLLSSTTIVYKNLVKENTIKEDWLSYEQGMDKFVEMEQLALEVMRMGKETSQEQLLWELKNRGFYYWNENLELLESFENLKLPPPVKDRNSKLKEYCTLRIQSYQIIYRMIEEDTDAYQAELEKCLLEVERLIKEISEN